MRTISKIVSQFTDKKQLLQDVREILLQLDPQFPEEEARYTAAAVKLKALRQDGEDYLCAREECFAAAMIHMVWQGLQLNTPAFDRSVQQLLLRGELDLLCQERNLALLPAYGEAQKRLYELYKSYSETEYDLINDISDYYAHLETVGYKLAHYYGYRLADTLLPHMLPGYVNDPVNSEHYRITLSKYLQMDLSQLD